MVAEEDNHSGCHVGGKRGGAFGSLAPCRAARPLHTGVSAGKRHVLTGNMVSVVAVGTFAQRLHAVLDLVGAAAAVHKHEKLEEGV